MQRRLGVFWIVITVALAGCTDRDAAGGQADLPGPPSDDVEFADPPPDAATAPEFTAELVDGTTLDAATLWADRPVVLLFTASWCGRCADQHREVAAAVDGHDGVALLGLVDESDEGAADYAEEIDIGHPLAVVPIEVWNSYAAEEPPLVALVGPGGSLLRGWPGGVDTDTLSEQLAALYVDGGAGSG